MPGTSVKRYFVRYKVNLKKTEEGYAVWVPGLPGCWSQGKTEEEALDNIKEAMQGYLETMAGIVKDSGLSFQQFNEFL